MKNMLPKQQLATEETVEMLNQIELNCNGCLDELVGPSALRLEQSMKG